ncbi:hypothetical protein FOZ60_013048 [Perkinsus olseni]|uniref:Uncharacterized protein n=1 Tax=Perkinsus olseni TaxID=32597 RepID=A0A7J6P8Q2_PEROL|nr:hypothetical protein FOZ60_013048 [Perkinsus olseni]
MEDPPVGDSHHTTHLPPIDGNTDVLSDKHCNAMIYAMGRIGTSLKDKRQIYISKLNAVRKEAEKKLSEATSIQWELRAQLDSANTGLSRMIEEGKWLREQVEVAQQGRLAAWEALKAKEKELAVAYEMHRKEAKLASERYKSLEDSSQRDLTIEKDHRQAEGEATRTGQERLMKCIEDKEETISKLEVTIGQCRDEIVSAKKETTELGEEKKMEIRARDAEIHRLGEEVAERERTIAALRKEEAERTEALRAQIEGLKKELSHNAVHVELAEYKERLRLKDASYEELARDALADSERHRSELSALHEKYQGERKAAEKSHGLRVLEMEQEISAVRREVEQERAKAAEREGAHKVVLLARDAEIQRFSAVVEDLESKLVCKDLAFKALVEETQQTDKSNEEDTEKVKLKEQVKELDHKLKWQTKRFEAVVGEFETVVGEKDKRVQALIEEVEAARRKVDDERASHRVLEGQWHDRVREKEKGYDRILELLAGKDSEIRAEQERTAAEARKVALIEREMERRDHGWRQKIAWHQRDYAELMSCLELAKMHAAEEWERWRAGVESLLCDRDKEREAWVKDRAALRLEIADWKSKHQAVAATLEEAKDKLRALHDEMDKIAAAFEEERQGLERQINQVKRDMENKLEQAEEQYQRLLAEYKALKARYEKDAASAGKLRMLQEEIEQLNITVEALKAEIQRLNKMIGTMKTQLRNKDFLVDDIKRETADILYAKEQAYEALVKQFNSLSNEFDKFKEEVEEERAEVLASWTAKEQEWRHQDHNRNMMVSALREDLEKADELNLEQQRGFDKLTASLTLALERSSMERSDTEGKMTFAIAKMFSENAEMAEEMKALERGVEEERATIHQKMKLLETGHRAERQKFKVLLASREAEASSTATALKAEIAELKAVIDNDEEAARLREKLQVLEEKVVNSDIAIAAAAAETTKLMQKMESEKVENEKKEEGLRRKAKAEEVKYRRMLFENEDLKELLQTEMDKASKACRKLEEQLAALPEVYDAEIHSLRDKLSALITAHDSEAANNQALKEELTREKRQRAEAKEKLERALRNAAAVVTAIRAFNLNLHDESATAAADSSSMTPPYKILFLDIDGVLNTVKGGPQVVFDTVLVRRVGEIVQQTGCKVVWTTYWRGFEDYITYAFCRLAELPVDVVVGRTKGTPHLNHSASNARVYTSRLEEIRAWMKEHPQLVEKYVILDDRDVVPPEDPMLASCSTTLGSPSDPRYPSPPGSAVEGWTEYISDTVSETANTISNYINSPESVRQRASYRRSITEGLSNMWHSGTSVFADSQDCTGGGRASDDDDDEGELAAASPIPGDSLATLRAVAVAERRLLKVLRGIAIGFATHTDALLLNRAEISRLDEAVADYTATHAPIEASRQDDGKDALRRLKFVSDVSSSTSESTSKAIHTFTATLDEDLRRLADLLRRLHQRDQQYLALVEMRDRLDRRRHAIAERLRRRSTHVSLQTAHSSEAHDLAPLSRRVSSEVYEQARQVAEAEANFAAATDALEQEAQVKLDAEGHRHRTEGCLENLFRLQRSFFMEMGSHYEKAGQHSTADFFAPTASPS